MYYVASQSRMIVASDLLAAQQYAIQFAKIDGEAQIYDRRMKTIDKVTDKPQIAAQEGATSQGPNLYRAFDVFSAIV